MPSCGAEASAPPTVLWVALLAFFVTVCSSRLHALSHQLGGRSALSGALCELALPFLACAVAAAYSAWLVVERFDALGGGAPSSPVAGVSLCSGTLGGSESLVTAAGVLLSAALGLDAAAAGVVVLAAG